MKYDQINIEEIEVKEYTPNSVVKKRKLRQKRNNGTERIKSNKDIWDYIILQTAIACGILAILLAVNLIAGPGLSQLVLKLGL